MSERWVVVLEATGDEGTVIEPDEVRLVLEAVAGNQPVALYGVDRYALQMTMVADGPAEALSSAISRWATTSAAVGTESRKLARAEVLSDEEHERECRREARLPVRSGGARNGHPERAGELLEGVFLDPLTNLASRALLCHHLEVLLALDPRGTHAVVRWELDHFSAFNARLGRSLGDAAIAAAARCARAAVRGDDMLARLEGDEFALVLDNVSEPMARAVAGRIVDGLALSVLGDGDKVPLTASVGIALSGPGAGAEQLLAAAAAAIVAGRTLKGRAT